MIAMVKTNGPVYVALTTVAVFVMVGTVIFHMLEDWTWIEAFYFSVATLSTVGYGDLAPTNDITRLVVGIYILFAVAAFAASLSVLGNAFLDHRINARLEHLEETRKSQKKTAKNSIKKRVKKKVEN